MGLDLLVFGEDAEHEIESVRVGMSTDFDHFRRVVADRLDRRWRRSRFPLLMRDDVWDARWDTEDVAGLKRELSIVASEFSQLPPELQPGIWGQHDDHQRLSEPASLLESFVTMDGELFVLLFIRFTKIAQQENGFVRTS